MAPLKRPHPPVVRNNDPPNAHQAAAEIEGYRSTGRELVLQILQDANGDWVDGREFEAAGSEGRRRVRELRSAGWFIDARSRGRGVWEYRLTGRKKFKVRIFKKKGQ
jgi:hypothetical protein